MSRMLRTPGTQEEWIAFNRQLMKAHLALRGMTYDDLRIALAAIGFVDSEPNIRTRVGRGRYSAVFMLQCLRAMNVGNLVLPTDASFEPPWSEPPPPPLLHPKPRTGYKEGSER